MQRIILFLLIFANSFISGAQTIIRPKLVVGIVVDQMRWDYLYRYADRYSSSGGFKRLLQNGFSCENTLIPYSPTVTGCGHASIYTGSVPAINGITGNFWFDKNLNRTVYCAEDKSVKTVGSNTEAGLMSPVNMFTTSVCDELRLATNFRSKVIGIALKDRGSILPAGHSANGAYWYDSKTGDWITSTYYMQELPKWVTDFNAKKLVDKYYQQDWNTMYPVGTYLQSSKDENTFENNLFGSTSFPHTLKQYIGKNYGILPATPYGNALTIEFAKAALNAEKLGADEVTDFLAISFSSPDYVGHSFGPNSIEQEDVYLRLDKQLGDFLDFLDTKVGKNEYLVFLSADHGVAHVPQFLKENKIPSGLFYSKVIDSLNNSLEKQFGQPKLISTVQNLQLYLNQELLDSAGINAKEVKNWIIRNITKHPGIARAFDLNELSQTTLNSKIKDMITNGYYPNRCGDIQLILQAQWIEAYSTTGTTHGLWNPYDAHIPLLWYGWGIKQGKTNRETYMSDIAPTISALLKIQMPSGTVGKVIEEVMK
ncbi:alkaline phosphatase family protein [Chitinophagaceae bacterium LB-8]|uniref:Alkaline phosphatase family protein n=1 Tax=Paraflavisolibacter caeni TaxID=2982496 RepID=A0A9X2XTU6_9BACT|nr:alkaline phosphatase PafA [Paraflavisolibacter caeni]MCU7549124.1 alkaline phosphatase family protein [Paraflavisolibacter caeni]